MLSSIYFLLLKRNAGSAKKGDIDFIGGYVYDFLYSWIVTTKEVFI